MLQQRGIVVGTGLINKYFLTMVIVKKNCDEQNRAE